MDYRTGVHVLRRRREGERPLLVGKRSRVPPLDLARDHVSSSRLYAPDPGAPFGLVPLLGAGNPYGIAFTEGVRKREDQSPILLGERLNRPHDLARADCARDEPIVGYAACYLHAILSGSRLLFRSQRPVAVLLTGLITVIVPVRARAADPYEIQVYDGSANASGVPSGELHVNTVPRGLRTSDPPELPPHHQTHFTLEPALGLLPWWEIGAYYQMTLQADGSFAYAGVKVRSKFVTPPTWDPHWRLGVNVELAALPAVYDRNRWGVELRPIAGWESDTWLFAFNPIVATPLAGPDLSDGPTFEPAAMAKVRIYDAMALGFEYYADLGPIAHPFPWQKQAHYLFEAADVLAVRRFELNLGIGEGLTEASNGLVIKAIAGYAWDP